MNTSERRTKARIAKAVRFSGECLQVELLDGRLIEVSLEGYPRLAEAQPAERENWRFVGGGRGIHWPDLDEDINVSSLLAGETSHETPESLSRWRRDREPTA